MRSFFSCCCCMYAHIRCMRHQHYFPTSILWDLCEFGSLYKRLFRHHSMYWPARRETVHIEQPIYIRKKSQRISKIMLRRYSTSFEAAKRAEERVGKQSSIKEGLPNDLTSHRGIEKLSASGLVRLSDVAVVALPLLSSRVIFIYMYI